MKHITEHDGINNWINQHRRVLITDFQLQYRDKHDNFWANTKGRLGECPKIFRSYLDNYPSCRLHVIFDLTASSNPRIPYTPAIHIPDLHHICLERQTPSPRISVSNSQEIVEVLHVISIPPPHHSQCRECKGICQKRIRQGIKALTTDGASITEYGTFSTWGDPTSQTSDPISSQAQEWGWHRLPYKGSHPPARRGTERLPTEVWEEIDKEEALCTIHEIQYFPAQSDIRLIRTAIARFNLDETHIEVLRPQRQSDSKKRRTALENWSGSEEEDQDDQEYPY